MTRKTQNPATRASAAPGVAIGYCRVSTDQQAAEGVSLAAQEGKIRDYCALNGLSLLRVEVDDGYSAKTLERPALARALEALKSGEASALVVYKLDRLSRSVRDLLEVVEEHFSAGKSGLHAVVERIDTVSPHGRALLTILGVLAQLERENTAERVKMGLAFLKSIGVTLGALPYGKRRGARGPDDKRAPIVPDERELEMIAEASMLSREGKSLRGIAAALATRGSSPRKGARWHPSTVASLLRENRKAGSDRRSEWSDWDERRVVVSAELGPLGHAESKNSERARRVTIRKKMSVKNAVASALIALRRDPPPLPAIVTLTMVQGPRGKAWDLDNATARAAGARDEVAKWLGCDDREGEGVDEWIVKIGRAARPSIIVEIGPGKAADGRAT